MLGGHSKTTDGGFTRIEGDEANPRGKSLGPGYYRVDTTIVRKGTTGAPFSIMKTERKIDWEDRRLPTS